MAGTACLYTGRMEHSRDEESRVLFARTNVTEAREWMAGYAHAALVKDSDRVGRSKLT